MSTRKRTRKSKTDAKAPLKVYTAKMKAKATAQQDDQDGVIILHLRVNVNKHTTKSTPLPYSTMGYEYEHFSENMDTDTIAPQGQAQQSQFYPPAPPTTEAEKVVSLAIAQELDADDMAMGRVLDSMVEYSEAKRHKKWPKHVNIACFWCNEFFDTIPIGIPVKVEVTKIKKGKKQTEKHVYHCSDNYCTFECATADLFKNKTGNYRERYSLLCALYKEAHNLPKIKRIRSALPKRALQRYGGPHSVEKFRKLSKIDEVSYSVIEPPMIPVLSQIETSYMEFNVANRNNSFIPINKHLSSNPVTNPAMHRPPRSNASGIHSNNTLMRFMKSTPPKAPSPPLLAEG